ncbi:hypothetical protein AB0903_28035 [Streptomyces sp. NPDC048389]|uniref:hypothetical protein n=1 Tax=Streptomyces sp. NPDC048389 TaxID=3154622 RepID=UPI003451B789
MIVLPPVPGRVVGLPRDERGYPVPAENAWVRGKPQLAVQDFRRCGSLYADARCAICGLRFAAGEVLYRLFAEDEVEKTLAVGACQRFDGPGHRDCMLFSAAVCPFFISAGARRGGGHPEVAKGTARGARAALMGFERVEIGVDQDPPHRASFSYRNVVENLMFEKGEQMASLLPEDDPVPTGPASVRFYWKTEPEVKRAWAAALRLARKHGRTHTW